MRGPVFISYPSESRNTLLLLKEYLTKEGVTALWVDRDQVKVGDEIRARVIDGVQKSSCCVLILNKYSAASSWCMSEVGGFLSLNKPLIIYPTDPRCEIPSHLDGIRFAADPEQVLEACRRESIYQPEDLFERCGMVRSFRIPALDHERETRIGQLVQGELARQSPTFTLTASTGYNYLHPQGKVWRAGLGDAIVHGAARVDVVLQSPFSAFALTRAVANDVVHQQWDDKGMMPQLKNLLRYPNISISVTWCPVNCSLFFTDAAVFYDPYLWGRPTDSGRTENNFWVFEFCPKDDVKYDCYTTLHRHFDFLKRESVPIEQILGDYERLSRAFETKVDQLKRSGRDGLAAFI